MMNDEYRKWKGHLVHWRQCLWLLYSSFIITHSSFSQPGVWQTHFSYRSAQSVGVIGQQVFAATRNGFYVYDKTTTETRLLNRADGLSDVSISRVMALPDQNRLILAYRSGNIDFLSVSTTGEVNEVRNINTIPSSTRIPADSRGINHLNRVGNVVYLSTDFGVVAFDLSRNEIRDTYFSPVSGGTPISVQATVVLGDSLYALTNAPAPRTRLAIRLAASVNFADPANWRTTQRVNIPFLSFAFSNTGTPTLTVPGTGTFTGALLQAPREVVPDGNRVWVADTISGLLEAVVGANIRQVAPQGPYANTFPNLFAYVNQLVGLPGGTQQSGNLPPNQPEAERYDLQTGRWQGEPIASFNGAFNSAAYRPDEQRLYLGSYGGGLWSQTEGQPPAWISASASIGLFIRTLTTDPEGNLWIATEANTGGATLHVRRVGGQFESFSRLGNVPIAQIVPDDFGLLWLKLTYGALLVFNPKTGQQRYFSTAPGDGNLPGNNVTALTKDRNGLIWVGTDRGVTVFDDPARALAGSVSANAPVFERRRLLGTETITAITVDGGNRKWIATESALYRFGPDGTTLENRFTPDDSPLPSTNINALVVEPVSGRVFISTSGGLVSYGGVATEPAEALTGITIFPNPVRPDFSGLVAIRGLTDNATVKILDAAGQLVFETRSQGGTATWNLADYRGRTAQTGVYLVVVVRADGTEGLAGKLAVVR